jgi:hypothetical protein
MTSFFILCVFSSFMHLLVTRCQPLNKDISKLISVNVFVNPLFAKISIRKMSNILKNCHFIVIQSTESAVSADIQVLCPPLNRITDNRISRLL